MENVEFWWAVNPISKAEEGQPGTLVLVELPRINLVRPKADLPLRPGKGGKWINYLPTLFRLQAANKLDHEAYLSQTAEGGI